MKAYVNTLKRIVDLMLVAVISLLFSWLFLVIILFYIVLFQWPIFFSQQRIGKDNIPFVILKFRTLAPDKSLSLIQRRFALGSWLRFFHLDELPQIYNIIKGEMSWVGPRPLPIEYLPFFSQAEMKRHAVKPGITGMAQVNGGNSITWKDKFEFDFYYVDNVSLLLDLKIIFKTILYVFSFREDVSLNESQFEGTL